MEVERESQLGICYECSVKESDSSEKQVTHCDLCDKCFCERHRKPKFPFFVDWDTISDVQGSPEIKAFFYTEYKREGGHPDFVYWRKTFEALDIEEKKRDELIRQTIDRMMHPEKYADLTVDSDSDRKKRVEILKNEERELRKQKSEQDIASDEYTKSIEKQGTITIENFYGDRFVVPREVYSNAEYREYLNHAKTMKSVKVIVDEYYEKKKKHWWQ